MRQEIEVCDGWPSGAARVGIAMYIPNHTPFTTNQTFNVLQFNAPRS